MSTTTLLLVGLASTVCQVLFALSVHRLRLLLFNLAATSLFMVQYVMLGQWIGFWSAAAGTTYTLLLALAYRFPRLQHVSLTYVFTGVYLAVFLLLNDWQHFQAYQAIPLLGGSAILFALHAKNLIVTKTIFLGAGALWLGYEFANTMYTQMLGEGFELIGNTIALFALLGAKRRGISRHDMVNLDTQAISILTGAIKLPVVQSNTGVNQHQGAS